MRFYHLFWNKCCKWRVFTIFSLLNMNTCILKKSHHDAELKNSTGSYQGIILCAPNNCVVNRQKPFWTVAVRCGANSLNCCRIAIQSKLVKPQDFVDDFVVGETSWTRTKRWAEKFCKKLWKSELFSLERFENVSRQVWNSVSKLWTQSHYLISRLVWNPASELSIQHQTMVFVLDTKITLVLTLRFVFLTFRVRFCFRNWPNCAINQQKPFRTGRTESLSSVTRTTILIVAASASRFTRNLFLDGSVAGQTSWKRTKRCVEETVTEPASVPAAAAWLTQRWHRVRRVPAPAPGPGAVPGHDRRYAEVGGARPHRAILVHHLRPVDITVRGGSFGHAADPAAAPARRRARSPCVRHEARSADATVAAAAVIAGIARSSAVGHVTARARSGSGNGSGAAESGDGSETFWRSEYLRSHGRHLTRLRR